MHDLNADQRKILSKNPNVLKVTNHHVVYTKSFKIKAIKLSLEGKPSDEIFKDAGIRLDFFKADYAFFNLRRWHKKYEKDGLEGFDKEARGSSTNGRSRSREDLTYDELLAVVEIQEEVIEALKNKKALAKK